MSLPIEWAGRVVAPPGYLLVERVKMPEKKGLIWLPDNYRLSTRAAEAVVVSVGRGIESHFDVGAHVLLASSAGRSVAFGPRGERTLWLVSQLQVLADVLVEESDLVTSQEPDLDAVLALDPDLEPSVDEGDPRGIR